MTEDNGPREQTLGETATRCRFRAKQSATLMHLTSFTAQKLIFPRIHINHSTYQHTSKESGHFNLTFTDSLTPPCGHTLNHTIFWFAQRSLHEDNWTLM